MSLKQHLFQECNDRCRSKRHAEELFAAIAKTNDLDEQITFLKTCFNHMNARDAVGRTVLHVAVSMGRISLVRWLLGDYDRLSKLQVRASRQRPNFAEWLNARDAENGWTALHRAVFYGQIDCARLLLQNEATRIYATDKEGLTAFDLANTAFYQFANAQFGGKAALQNGKAKLNTEAHSTSASEDDSDLEVSDTRTRRTQARKEAESDERGMEVLVWGTNANHTLGCESDARVHPEALDTFRRARVSITQMCLTRFHSIFLSHDGAVYTCGHGRGGRLGHSTDESFILPKRVHVADIGGTHGAAAKCVEVTQICASENHSVMIGRNGIAYVCGSNEYGQLGNAQPSAVDGSSQKAVASSAGSQKAGSKAVQRGDATQTRTSVLDIQALRISSSWKGESRLVGACTSRVHSVFWTAHAVFTCGLNQGQLGYAKTQQSQLQPGTGVTAGGMAASGELRPVTLLDRPNLAVRFAVCSELATCVYTTDGDLFLLSRFTVKKLPMKLDNVTKLFLFSVTRERENSQTAAGSKVLNALLALRTDGELFFWHEATSNASFQRVRRAPNQFLLRFRDCDVVEWSFSDTATQQAFTIELLACTPFGSLLRATVSTPLTIGADYSLHVGARVPNVQRVTRVFCELLSAGSRARNFGALQAPSIRVDRDRLVVRAPSEFSEQLAAQFRELQADDSYDLVLLLCRPAGPTGPASCVRFFAHRFVVASRCSYLEKLIAAAQPLDGSDSVLHDASAPLQVRIDADVDAGLFRLLLQFIYASDCPLFVPGYRVELQSTAALMRTNTATLQSADYFTAIAKMNDDYNAERNASDAKQRAESRTSKGRSETTTSGDADDVERIVAELDRCATLKQDAATKKKAKTKTKSKSKAAEKAERARAQDDALSELRNLAVRFGMTEFVRRLSTIRLNQRAEVELRHTDPEDDTSTSVRERHAYAMRLDFDRKRFEDLCDIQLQSNDGQLFACHKCILMARVEYFRHMFIAQSGWREAAPSLHDGGQMAAQTASGLPFAAPVCEALLSYLYTDELPTTLHASSLSNAQPEKTLEQFDLLCGLLIAADHLLLDRLRQLVEYELCELLTLRNAAFMLQLATFYNAIQLRTACLEFVRLNIVTFLEQRLLDELSDELLAAVSEYYRTTEPLVAGRALLSSSLDDYPTRNDLAQLVRDYPKQRDADLLALAAATPQLQLQPQTSATSPNSSFTKPATPECTAPPPTSPGPEQHIKTPSISPVPDEPEPEADTPWSSEQPEECVNSSARPARRAIVVQPTRIDPPTYDFNSDSQLRPGWSGPKWTSSIRSPTGETPLLSDVVVTDRSKMINLRDIIAEEKLSSGRPDSQTSTTRSQPIKHKPSQKERKNKATAKTEAETHTVESPPALGASVNVWDARRARMSSGSQSAVLSQQTEANRLRQNDFPGLQQAQQPTTAVARNNEKSKVVNFKQLLNAELADEREVARLTVLTSARANLECVEIEEHAIQQLTELYNAENTFDVHITVERVAWDERGKVKLGWVPKKP